MDIWQGSKCKSDPFQKLWIVEFVMSYFIGSTPWKYQKTYGFVMFKGRRARDQSDEMDQNSSSGSI